MGIPLKKLTEQSHILILHNAKKGGFLQQDEHIWLGGLVTVQHPCASGCWLECQSALTFTKIVFQVYVTAIVLCSINDFAMSSGERDSLNNGFPYLLCYASVCCNFSAIARQNLMKISHQGCEALRIQNMISEKKSATPTQTNF